ncbi:hypothetical protein QOT17_021254 [Balamuthia mandrillaris]
MRTNLVGRCCSTLRTFSFSNPSSSSLHTFQGYRLPLALLLLLFFGVTTRAKAEEERFTSPVDVVAANQLWGVGFRESASSRRSYQPQQTREETSVLDEPFASQTNLTAFTGVQPDFEIFFLNEQLERTTERFVLKYGSLQEVTNDQEPTVVFGPIDLNEDVPVTVVGPVVVEEEKSVNGELKLTKENWIRFEVEAAEDTFEDSGDSEPEGFERKGGTFIIQYVIFEDGNDNVPLGETVNDTIAIPALTSKVYFIVRNWTFSEEPNTSLQVTLTFVSIGTNGTSTVDSVDENGGGDFSLGESIFGIRSRFLEEAEVDGTLVPIQVESTVIEVADGSQVQVVLTFPRFTEALVYDPDFSVLVGQPQDDGQDQGKDDNDGFCCSSGGFIAAVTVSVVVVVLITIGIIVGVVFNGKIRTIRTNKFLSKEGKGMVSIGMDLDAGEVEL